jgi:2-polyprenyl-3-methyl-5-hydroxy-6-metoxy-1,4-benzoquinol methylase
VEHSLETLNACPSCGKSVFTNQLSAKDHTYSKKKFHLVKCNHCTLVFTNPRPKESSIGQYYDSPEYVSHTDTNKGLLFILYGLVKTRALAEKIKLLESFTTTKTILDYGAGSGDFSAELADSNWRVTAFEPDTNARTKIVEKSSKVKLSDTIDSIPTESKSIITLWHVLEHVHRLKQTIGQFKRILENNGHLVIAVPNYNSKDAEHYKAEWSAYDVPRHLYHFDYLAMKTLIENQGFVLKTIKPLWFDSYYVSLLSEKNRNSGSTIGSFLAWPIAFCIGLISNFYALRSTERCSSIIYIFQKAV